MFLLLFFAASRLANVANACHSGGILQGSVLEPPVLFSLYRGWANFSAQGPHLIFESSFIEIVSVRADFMIIL